MNRAAIAPTTIEPDPLTRHRQVSATASVRSERLTPELGDARLQREGRSAPVVREMTAAVPESHWNAAGVPL